MPSPGGKPTSSSSVGATSASTPSCKRAAFDRSADEEQRYRVERVGRHGSAVFVTHLVGVAVVGRDAQQPGAARHRIRHAPQATVDELDTL